LGSLKGLVLITSVMATLILISFVSNDVMLWLSEQAQLETVNFSLSKLLYEWTLSIIQSFNP
jgi:hypothetical protein